MYRLLLLVVLLIVHGSLYPWHFQPLPTADSIAVLVHSWPAAANRYLLRDIAVNLALYLPLGVVGFLAFRRQARRSTAMAATLLTALLLSAGMEVAQRFVPSRTSSLFDVVLNVAGAAIGLAVSLAFEDRLRAMTTSGAATIAPAASGALLLLSCWIGYQIFPFFPDMSRAHVAEKVLGLARDSWSAWSVLVSVTEWAVVGQLLASSGHPKRCRRTFIFLLLLLPARLLLVGRSVTGPELAGGALAFVLWQGSGPATPSRTRWLAWFLALVLLVDGLGPLRIQDAATPFRWLPFQGVLESDWQTGLAVLLRKSFLYGTAIWLLRHSGWPLTSAAVVTSLYLAAIEAAQVRLPGRTSEITDPLLALIMAFILAMLPGPAFAADGAVPPSQAS